MNRRLFARLQQIEDLQLLFREEGNPENILKIHMLDVPLNNWIIFRSMLEAAIGELFFLTVSPEQQVLIVDYAGANYFGVWVDMSDTMAFTEVNPDLTNLASIGAALIRVVNYNPEVAGDYEAKMRIAHKLQQKIYEAQCEREGL